MKKFITAVLLGPFFCSSGALAADGIWANPAGGTWNTPANWSGNIIADGVGSTATFNGPLSAPVVVNSGYTLGMLIASSYEYVLNGDSGSRVLNLDNGASPAEVSVAAGGSLTTGFKFDAKNKSVIKTGTGLWNLDNSLYNCSGLVIEEGDVVLNPGVGGDGLNLGNNKIELKSSTSLKYNKENLISNNTVLDINSGAVVDMKGFTDNIGSFTGAGVVTNFTAPVACRLEGRTLTFSGYAYGTQAGNITIRSAGTFVLGASQSLEQIGFNDIEVSGTQLAFAPGIGTFGIGWIESLNPITLEALDGKAVQLALGTAARTSIIRADVKGTGGLTVAGPASLTVRADTSYTGPTIIQGNNLTVGDGVTYNGAITNSSCITVMSGRTLSLENKDAMTYPNSITGVGIINKNRSSDITFNALDMQGGQLNVNSGSVTINGGSSSNLAIRVDKGLDLVVNGGHFKDSSINILNEGSLTGSASVTLNNGSSTNLNYSNNSLLATLNVIGGDWHFSSGFGADSRQNFKYTQSGGKANFDVSRGMYNTNRAYGVVSGGHLNIRYVSPPRGLGLLISENGKVTMEGTQRLSSDGWSHDLILTNNAFVDADTIQLMSKGTSASDTLVELAGGTLAFNTLNNGDCDAINTIQFKFNGGILRPKGSPTINANPLYSTFSVLEGGALIDVALNGGGCTFQPVLYSGVASGEDGGLIKRGPGRLDLSNPMRYTGKTVVQDGLLRTLSMDQQPLGSNTIQILQGEIRVQSGSNGSEALVQGLANASTSANLSFGGGAARLSLDNPATGTLALEIGHAAAMPDTALNRVDHGTLLVAPFGGLGAGNFGVKEKMVVNGGLSTLNGMVAPYILGTTLGGSNWFGGSFLDYDPTKGLIEATYTSGLGGGSTSLAALTAAATTDDVHVHGLRLAGADLTINSGKTLTIGDGVNPAGLILNRNSAGRSAVLGGTIDFQGSEGIVYIDNFSGAGHTISSTITGDNGITITGFGNTEILNLTAPAGNTYLGATRIQSGRVTIANTQGFSSGDLYIHGDDQVGGCFLFNFAGTITNPMHLAGVGGPLNYCHGALTFLNTTGEGVIDAPVELMRDARIGASGGTSVGRFAQSITGTGELEINIDRADQSAGTIIFSAPNSYDGRTIINRGVLGIEQTGTFGLGDVVNNGTLLFNNSSPKSIANDIAGLGVIRKTNSGALTLTGDVTCDIEVVAGSVVLASGAALPSVGLSGTLDANGENIAISTLNGTGTITNSSATAATLELNIAAGTDSIYWGSINDGGNTIDLNKDGAGTLILGGSSSYQGTTTIAEGTIKLSTTVDKVPYLNDLAYQLDASTPDTLTLSGVNVTAWADSSGNNIDFVQAINDAYNQYPSYVADAINGKGAVRFEGNWNRLYATNAVSSQTVLIVNNKTGQMNLSGIWGKDKADYGIRAVSATMWQDGDNNDFARSDSFYVNGINTRSYVQGTPHILAATTGNAQNFAGAIGDYWGNVGQHRSYIGDIGEVLVYKKALKNAQREIVEKYLTSKWFGSTQPTVLTNVLPAATALVLEKNGALDLAGSVQTVASLSGDGTILSSGPGAGKLTVGSDNRDTTFGGSIADLAQFTKAGSGLLTLTGISSFTGETVVAGGALQLSGGANRLNPASSVTIENNAIFDVNYLSQTLSAIGGSGTVMDCDGLTVTGSVAPGGVGAVGTLTFDGSPSLAGSYSFTAASSSADLINVQGDIDISSLALNAEELEQLTALSYTILQCSGTLTGTFASDNLPPSWSINYDYATGIVTLHRLVGTLFIVR